MWQDEQPDQLRVPGEDNEHDKSGQGGDDQRVHVAIYARTS
jgi:hypothetical protein